MHHDPLTPDGRDAVAGYAPVQLSRRRNGWTAERQRIFLIALAETGSVSVACKTAGITARSAYRLRADPRGAAFAAAWHRALYIATNALVALAFERATKGTYREYWKNGELVAETRQPSDSMLKFLLTHLMPSMFACKPQDNWYSAWHAQQNFPGLLDKLADCDVRADRLSAVDFEPQPRAAEIDPPIPPGEENDSWQEDVDYGPEPWGGTAGAQSGAAAAPADTGPRDDGPDGYPPASIEERAKAYLVDEIDEDEPLDDDDFDDEDFDDDDLDDEDLDEDDDDFDDDEEDEDDADDDDDALDGSDEGEDPDAGDGERAQVGPPAPRGRDAPRSRAHA